jgi:hypothetical protein
MRWATPITLRWIVITETERGAIAAPAIIGFRTIPTCRSNHRGRQRSVRSPCSFKRAEGECHAGDGGRVVCAGIHMSDIPGFPYRDLWEERQLLSVANLTRQDGIDLLRLVPQLGITTKISVYQPQQANQALADLRAGRFEGAAVLTP